MKILAVIPSRFDSTRLPGKPLLNIKGKPLIQHVYEGAAQSKLINKLIVATDSNKIMQCVTDFGGEVMLTSKNHKTGSDRIAEVATKMPEYEIIANIQGDIVGVNNKIVDALIKPLIEDEEIQMTALKQKITNKADLLNSAVIKVVTDRYNHAVYYSRFAIPYNRDNNKVIFYRNKGMYGYRRDFLLQFTKTPQTPAEKAESLEQLRAIENDIKIYVTETNVKTFDINTEHDLEVTRNQLNND